MPLEDDATTTAETLLTLIAAPVSSLGAASLLGAILGVPPNETTATPAITPVATPLVTPAPVSIGRNVGQRAPDFTLDVLGGGSVQLSDLRGKPVFLNIFATWCPPCVEEMPYIQEASNQYGDRVHFLGISTGQSAGDIDSFIRRNGFSYPIACDPRGSIDADYHIQYIPLTLLLDADGMIVEMINEGLSRSQVFRAVEALLR